MAGSSYGHTDRLRIADERHDFVEEGGSEGDHFIPMTLFWLTRIIHSTMMTLMS